MSFNIQTTDDSERDIKQLSRRYRSFKENLSKLLDALEQDPQQGEPLGKDCYKVRLAISAKRKGKSGGARVITCVKIVDEQVFLIALYDKSDLETMKDAAIVQRLKNAGLL